VPRILTDEQGRPAPAGIECLHAAAGLYEAFFVEDTVGGQEDLPVDMADAGVGPTERSIQPGVVQPVSVHLVEAERQVERRGPGFLVLPAEIVKQLVGGDGKVPDPALEEIAGERGLRSDHKLGRLGPVSHLPKEGPQPAQILLISPFVGAHLGNGEAEHD
jgi:hypothetical protein